MKLGSFTPAISRTGLLHDSCTRIAWWHNGQFRGEWPSRPLLDQSTVDTALTDRTQHTLLELRPGDLLAFQILQASYYCYKHFSAISVNNLNVTTIMPGILTHYAREYSVDWYDPATTLNASNTATDESEPNLQKFLPPRPTMLQEATVIVPGVDYWAPDEGANLDTRTGDWFWRIQIPADLPDPQTISF